MGQDKQASQSADPKLPHAYVGKMNVPFSIPRGGVVGMGGMLAPEAVFTRPAAPAGCAVCGKPTTDKIHEAAEQAAEAQEANWPL